MLFVHWGYISICLVTCLGPPWVRAQKKERFLPLPSQFKFNNSGQSKHKTPIFKRSSLTLRSYKDWSLLLANPRTTLSSHRMPLDKCLPSFFFLSQSSWNIDLTTFSFSSKFQNICRANPLNLIYSRLFKDKVRELDLKSPFYYIRMMRFIQHFKNKIPWN